jgi:hypothetical protein
VFPLTAIPQWLAVRFYYVLVSKTARWLLLPLVILYAVHALVKGGGSADVLIELGYDVGVLVLVFGLFLFVTGQVVNRFVRSSAPRVSRTDEADLIRSSLESGDPPPLAGSLPADVGVFVSGHTHAPSLTRFHRPTGNEGAIVNSGCWLRQLQATPALLGSPPVFVSRFVQTHVRVYRADDATQVELWEHPRPAPQRLRVAERLAVLGRLPAESDDTSPRVRGRTAVPQMSSR